MQILRFNGFLKFVKICNIPIFHSFECNLYYLRKAFVYNKSLRIVYVGVSIKHVKLLLIFLV